MMIEQNYDNHTRYVKGFHFLLAPLLLLGTIAAVINAVLQILANDNGLGSILIALLFICSILLFYFLRTFSTTLQDRAIRAEESLRYYILTGKTIDTRLSIQQIIALRFAYDKEFLVLADRAIKENLTPDEIKRAIKKWKADNYRA